MRYEVDFAWDTKEGKSFEVAMASMRFDEEIVRCRVRSKGFRFTPQEKKELDPHFHESFQEYFRKLNLEEENDT